MQTKASKLAKIIQLIFKSVFCMIFLFIMKQFILKIGRH